MPSQPPFSRLEIFRAALRLGLTSFGGPVAHLGYFHAEYVQRRRWLSEAAYADLVALCQFLPGPASSHGRSHSPVFTSAVHGPLDLVIALGAFGLLVFWRRPPWLVVAAADVAGMIPQR